MPEIRRNEQRSIQRSISNHRHHSEPHGPVLALAERIWRLCPEYSEIFGYETPTKEGLSSLAGHDGSKQSVSDYLDLSCLGLLDPALGRRNARKAVADLIPPYSTVLDLSCGTMSLEPILPEECHYVPCDVVARNNRALVVDLDLSGEQPDIKGATIVAAIGILEYVVDIEPFLLFLKRLGIPTILTYHTANGTPASGRRELGRLSHLTKTQLIHALTENGFFVNSEQRIDKFQILFSISPKT